MGRRRVGRHKGASAICDRTGWRYPMSEMVDEDGLLVHKSATDGGYSLLKHPLTRMGEYLRGKTGDPKPIKNASPDQVWAAFITYQGACNTGGNSLFESRAGLTRQGLAAITGTGSLSALGAGQYSATSTIAGAGATVSVGVRDYPAASNIAISGTVAASGTADYSATSSISGVATVVAAYEVITVLLEGFEAISGSDPWISTYSWYDVSAATPTVTRTTSNVTEGTYSWRTQDTSLTGSSVLGAGSAFGGSVINLAGYTTLEVDVYVTTIGASSYALATVQDSAFIAVTGAISTMGVTGATTLTLDITDITTGGGDLSNVVIFIGVENSGGPISSAYDIYFDNLRVS